MQILQLFDTCFPEAKPRDIVFTHSRLVADKALLVARGLNDPNLDLNFLEEAALLHDIGVGRTHAPGFGCTGSEPYIRHGLMGREILEGEGLPHHALVCERHIGVGLTVADIEAQNLPLPRRDMTPRTREERLVCFADLFYSKHPGRVLEEKGIPEIRRGLAVFGAGKVAIFDSWLQEFLPGHHLLP